MKTEAEILQYFKEQSAAKKLSVSEKTMQKRAAKLSARQFTDEAAETAALEDAIDDFVVQNDEIRFQRSLEKKVWEEKSKPNPTPPAPTPPEPPSPNDEMIKRFEAMEKKLAEAEKKEQAAANKEALLKSLYKDYEKADKALINKFVGLLSIDDKTDIDAAKAQIVELYNETVGSSIEGVAVPPTPKATPISEEYKNLFERAAKE